MNPDADPSASPTFPAPDPEPAPDFGNVNEEPPTSPAAIAAAAAELIAAATAVAAAVSPMPSSLSSGQSPSVEDPGLAAGAISPSDLRARPAHAIDLPPMNPLEQRLNYKFRNPLLLAEALTHPSLAHETQRPYFDNQRLEYLGDAVIQVVFSEHLFRLYPEAGEGFLTKMRARLVSGEALRSYALTIRLGQYLMMGRGDENSGGRQRGTTLADAYEALVGAMFIDSGGDLATSRRFLLAQAQDRLKALDQQPLEVNPKGQLQEILQALPYPDPDLPSSAPRNPTYAILLEAGPDHAKRFAANVVWAGHALGRGEGASKQQAETAAALDALRRQAWVSLPTPVAVDGAETNA